MFFLKKTKKSSESKGLPISIELSYKYPHSDVMKTALRDAEILLQENGPVSCVDRIHTAFHSYLTEVCKNEGLPYTQTSSLPQLFRIIYRHHPALKEDAFFHSTLANLGGIMGNIQDARNNKSLAHPNDLPSGVDATLMINLMKVLVGYFDQKFSEYGKIDRRCFGCKYYLESKSNSEKGCCGK